jgi:amino-acid N-acetyltransferase
MSDKNILVAAQGTLRQQVIELLEQNGLPSSDIDANKILYALLQNDAIVGTGGVEYFGEHALIRSVSVTKNQRGNGLGSFITRELEENCKERGIYSVYLLTMTAKDFFSGEGYSVVDRDQVPQSIKNTSEFSSICPTSAVVMKKNLK